MDSSVVHQTPSSFSSGNPGLIASRTFNSQQDRSLCYPALANEINCLVIMCWSLLLAAPFVFGFYGVGGAAVIIPMVLGAGLILYSLLTNYELGIPGLKFIPMWVHLVFDLVASAFLAISPFLFGFINKAPNAWLPHIIAGVVVIVLVLVSQTRYQPKAQVMA